jgi:DNA-binding HxlR family transcriptional regulator
MATTANRPRAAVTPAPKHVACDAADWRAREMLTRIGDKWSVHVIYALCEAGTLRFNEIRRRVDGISQRMLTVTLRGLERDGLVHRAMYPEVPPRVEYALTPLGATLRKLVHSLVEWSHAHIAEVDAARRRYDQQPQRDWAASQGR